MIDLEPKIGKKGMDVLDMSPKKNGGVSATGNGFDMLNMDIKPNTDL